MDVASLEFCRAVARKLTEHTKLSWKRRREERWSKPGFYVVSEYGLDPLDWPEGRVAGVELLTPPLPLEHAEEVRRAITDAVVEIDGDFNLWADEFTRDCAWHINLDAGDELRLDSGLYGMTANELPLLLANGRLFNPHAGLQRYAYGPTLLRHLARDSEGLLLQRAGLHNLVISSAGSSKNYAANFDKLSRGYVEFRYFSAQTFFLGPALPQLLSPITQAFEIWRESELQDRLFRRFRLLQEWLNEHQGAINVRYSGYGFTHAMGILEFYGEPLAHLMFNGTGQLRLYRSGDRVGSYCIEPVFFADLPQATALLLLDLAELKNMGVRLEPIANQRFRKAVAAFAAKLRRAGLTDEGHRDAIATALRTQAEERATWTGDLPAVPTRL